GAHYAAPHFSAAPRLGGGFSPRMSTPRSGYTPRYSAGSRYAPSHFAAAPSHAFGGASGAPRVAASSSWNGHVSGWGGHGVGGVQTRAVRSWYGPHWGVHPYWSGGWWHGYYWPRAYYGWSFPWFYPVLPLGYATFWWGGVPFYYVNSVYYSWDPSQNG